MWNPAWVCELNGFPIQVPEAFCLLEAKQQGLTPYLPVKLRQTSEFRQCIQILATIEM